MGKMSRDKGARGEREIIDLLQPIANAVYAEAGQHAPQLKRTSSMQADGGGCDIAGIDWLALEVKRCETLHVAQWWQQCLKQAKSGQMPVLAYRRNSGQWCFKCYVCAIVGADSRVLLTTMDKANFVDYFALLLHFYLQRRIAE